MAYTNKVSSPSPPCQLWGQKTLQQRSCRFVEHRKTCGRIKGVAQVREKDIFWTKSVQKEVSAGLLRVRCPLPEQHVGRARARRLHHKRLVKRLTPVWRSGQSIRTRQHVGGEVVRLVHGCARQRINRFKTLPFERCHPVGAKKHRVNGVVKRWRRADRKFRDGCACQHHSHKVGLPTASVNRNPSSSKDWPSKPTTACTSGTYSSSSTNNVDFTKTNCGHQGSCPLPQTTRRTARVGPVIRFNSLMTRS